MYWFVTTDGLRAMSFGQTANFIENKASSDGGLSISGLIAVLHNVTNGIAEDIHRLQNELITKRDPFVVNGLLFSSITRLQHLLDGIASFCQYQNQLEVQSHVYFSTYCFERSTCSFVDIIQKRILGRTFKGQKFNDLANGLKHNLPWVGLVSESGSRSLHDVFDGDGIGIVIDVVVPVYKDACEILNRLNAGLGNKKIGMRLPLV